MKCTVYDLGIMGLNPSRVELGVCRTFIKVIREPLIPIASASACLRAHACPPQAFIP